MDARPHRLLGEGALGEELLEQRIVRLGDVLDQLLVHRVHPFLQFARGRNLLVLSRTVGRVGADLAAQHVEHLIEARTGIHRHLHGEHLGAEPLADLLEQEVVIDILFVERIDDDDLRDAELRRIVPHHLRANPDSVPGVDHDDREVDHPEGIECLAAEIEISRGVDGIQPAVLPLQAERRGVDRYLPLLLAHMIIGHRRSLHNAAHAVDDATAHEHGFRQHGLAGGRMTDDREVANVRRLIGFHRRIN